MGTDTLKLVLAYAMFAGLWILLSDDAVLWLFNDPVKIIFVSTLKGWLFVAVTSLLLYALVRRLLSRALTLSLRERAAHAEQLRTQQLLAAIVDSSSDAIFAKDRDGRYLLFNRETARVTGKSAELVLGCDDTALFPPEQAEALRADDRRVLAENMITTYEETLSTVDGERIYLATKGPLRDDKGHVIGLFGVSRDITERKRADAEVRALSRAMEQSPASVMITDREGRIEYVNPRFEQATGYTRAEMVGRNPRILKSGLVSSDTYAQLWATISGGGEWRGELCNRRKNGELFWEYAAISGLKDESGEVGHYIAVKEDITERKASESKIRRLGELYAALSQCNQAVMHCGTEQELFQQVCRAVVSFGGMKLAWIGLVDNTSKRVTPVASYGDTVGYVANIEVSVDPDKPSGRGPVGTAIRENRPCWCQDFLHDPTTAFWRERARNAGWQAAAGVPLHRNGIAIGALSIYSPELNAFDETARRLVGEMTANISFALDNFAREAERKRLEEVHLQVQKLESLGTLAGGIAHDFNNILAAIRGNADLAVKEVGPDHIAAESLKEIGKAGARASELVRRITAFGRPGEPCQDVVDLGAVVDEVLKLLRSTLPAGISLRNKFAQDTPHVLADAGQIHEVIVNLTTNAAYAIGPRVGSIEYCLDPVQVGEELARSIPGIRAGRYARLTVTDSGCGMNSETLARIFDAFYTTKPVGEGTGLGLSMVHGIMRSHGGAVTVESVPGQGSSFALYFPAAAGQAQKEEHAAPAQIALSAGQRVLYVDDEEALVFLASRVLTHLGHQISGFTDPEQALEAFRAQPQDFDVVVTDLSMPHMSGFELAREVLAVRPGIPVLMTTGYIGEEDEGNARAAGISEVILKPVTMEELGQVLDRLIRAVSRE